eukprot:SAG11_NODE_3160_length_2642_cov_3.713608_1_plen_483_part_00
MPLPIGPIAPPQALSQRWLSLPLASLGVGGSLRVTVGLTGAFIAWAALVPLADATCALALAPRSSGLPPPALIGAAAVVPLTATLVLSRSPMFGRELGFFGLGYTLLGGGAALALGGRGRAAQALYCGWALVESVSGLAAGWGLNMAAGSLLSDEMGATEAEWKWQASLVSLNYFLCAVSAVVSALIACALFRRGRTGARESGEDDGGLGLELSAHFPSTVDSLRLVRGGPADDAAARLELQAQLRRPAVLAALGWYLLLVCGTAGFAVTQLDLPGLEMGGGGWLETPCAGCECESVVTICAAEGETCRCDGFVSLCADSQWSAPRAVNGSISCTIAAFGGADPYPNHAKHCECNTGSLGATGQPEQVVVVRDLRYGSNTNRRPADGAPCGALHSAQHCHDARTETLFLDLYRPSSWVELEEPRSRPAIVLVHGGAFAYGSKNDTGDEARYFAQHGFVAVSRFDAADWTLCRNSAGTAPQCC